MRQEDALLVEEATGARLLIHRRGECYEVYSANAVQLTGYRRLGHTDWCLAQLQTQLHSKTSLDCAAWDTRRLQSLGVPLQHDGRNSLYAVTLQLPLASSARLCL